MQLDLVASAPLGKVTGAVRRPHEIRRPLLSRADPHDPDARSDGMGLPVKAEAMGADRRPDLIGDAGGPRQPAVLEKHPEFIPTQSRQGVAGPHSLPHEVAQLPEQLIPCQVTAGVVDPFEPVQVDEAERVLRVLRRRARQGAIEAPFELGAIDQAGEGVVSRLMRELPGDHAGMGYVAREHSRAADRTRWVMQGRRRDVQGTAFASGDRRENRLASAGGPAPEALGHRTRQRLAGLAREWQDLGERPAARRFPAPSGQLLGRAIEEIDTAAAVGHEDRVHERVERARRKLRRPDRLLDRRPGADLMHHRHHQTRFGTDHRREGDLDRELGPVRAKAREPPPHAHRPHGRGAAVPGASCPMRLAHARGQQRLDGFAPKLVGRRREERLGPAVERDNSPAAVHDEHRVR